MRWEPGDALVIESDGDSLLVRSLATVVREVQESFAPDRTPVVGEVSVVVLDAAGQAVGQTRVFVRDLSRSGCGLWSRARVR